jgi:hypothetical protein
MTPPTNTLNRFCMRWRRAKNSSMATEKFTGLSVNKERGKGKATG